MSKESVYQFLADRGFADHYVEFDESSTATVALAAQAIGCEEGRIAKTMSLSTREGAIVVVFNGVARLDNRKYKDTFHEKARFLQGEEVVEQTGHPIGGVCPFALKAGVRVFLDESLKVYEYVYPAAGAPNNAVRLTIGELEELTGGSWISVAKTAEAEE
ncbi:MAG: YbaK/EbsC family protein [Clostridiales bacterium]|nr:YbaK/EbsC family protein [Clostridiales bacterium]